MSLVLHLSDTHFGTERPEVSAALLQLAQEVQPDIAILSGDVTQRARRGQFTAARLFLDTLAAPVKLVIPGNHDVPLFNVTARLFAPYSNYCSAFGQDLEPEYSSHDLLVIGVNTTRQWRHKDGEVSAEQIERVSLQLQHATPAQLRIVVVHQPIFVVRECDLENLLNGARQAIQAWAKAGADLILSGHIHMAYVRNLKEHLPNVPRSIWTASAGTAISKRVRDGEPNSVNLIHYASAQWPKVCKVERLDFDVLSARFKLKESTTLALS